MGVSVCRTDHCNCGAACRRAVEPRTRPLMDTELDIQLVCLKPYAVRPEINTPLLAQLHHPLPIPYGTPGDSLQPRSTGLLDSTVRRR